MAYVSIFVCVNYSFLMSLLVCATVSAILCLVVQFYLCNAFVIIQCCHFFEQNKWFGTYSNSERQPSRVDNLSGYTLVLEFKCCKIKALKLKVILESPGKCLVGREKLYCIIGLLTSATVNFWMHVDLTSSVLECLSEYV